MSTRTYELKDIEKVATFANGVHFLSEGLTEANIAYINNIADLLAIFNPYG